MGDCHLCSLPTPDPPIESTDGSRIFCCPGCREISNTLGNVELTEDEGLSEASETAGSVPPDAATAYFSVEGMHCTTCEAFLDRLAATVDNVYAVEANYGLGSAKVHYNPDAHGEASLAPALSGYGYTFRTRQAEDEPGIQGRQRSTTAQRLIVGGFCTMLIMPWYFFYLYPIYIGFESGILDLGRTTTVGIYFPLVVIGFLTTIVLLYTGYPVLRGAWISLRTSQPNMDLLVTIAALAAYVYSVLALADGRIHLYFDVSVMVIMVVTLGRYVEEGVRASAAAELSIVTSARVNEAVRLTDSGRETVAVDTLAPSDEVLVEPGDRIPLDGTILRGHADIDESFVTGESLPIPKGPGDDVIGGGKVIDEPITVEIGSEATSTIDRIATAMWDIQSRRPGVQRVADALATVFVPVVLMLGVAVTGWRLLGGEPVGDALLWGLTILLVSCPCAMGLATPLAVSAGLRDALRSGIVVTNQSIFEVVPKVETVILDKTGTVTTGSMHVREVIGHPETLALAAAVEQLSNHPIAEAITAANAELHSKDVALPNGSGTPDSSERDAATASDIERIPGAGVTGVVNGTRVVVGNTGLVSSRMETVPQELTDAVDRVETNGDRAIVVGWDGRARGVVAVTDRERSEWRAAVEALGDCEVVLLTGDDSQAVDQYREEPAIDQVFAGVPPDAKAETVRRLSAESTTIMVGDGTNDAPALAAADLGVALGTGTAEASAAADVVIVEDDLRRVGDVFRIARGARRRTRENIGWALMYNAVALPLAIVGLINPFFAAVAMALSSLLVVTNSKRPVS